MPLEPESDAPNDFDFEIGSWTVKHRRLKQRLKDCHEWVEFEGLSSTQKILGGYGNLEDNQLFFPEATFRAIALRSYDRQAKRWSIWWLDGRYPGAIDTPVVGGFENGVGLFFANDSLEGRPIKIRFTWSIAAAGHPHWEQAFSADDGKSWETNWIMDFFPRP
jgi:hypothetical protein